MICVCLCVCVCVSLSVCMSVTSPRSSHRALFFLYRLFHLTKLFDLPDDVIATAAACFGEGLRAGGGVVFKLKWRRYIIDYTIKMVNWSFDSFSTWLVWWISYLLHDKSGRTKALKKFATTKIIIYFLGHHDKLWQNYIDELLLYNNVLNH